MSRTVALSPEIIISLQALSTAENINVLSAEEAQNQLRSARTLALEITNLPQIDDDLHNLQSQLRAQEEALSHANGINNQHLNTIRVLTAAATPRTEVLRDTSEKHPDPERFDGTRSRLRGFLGQLRLKLSDRRRFPTDQDQLRYAASRLEGAALDHILPHLNNDQVGFENLDALIKTLENAFDDPDRAGTAQRTLRSLKQGSRDFAAYYAEFQRFAPETGWDNTAKRFALREGLSRELQSALIPVVEPEDLSEFVEQCQRIDQKLRRFGNQNRTPPQYHSRNTNSSPRPPVPVSTSTGTHSGPMDLSAVRRKLTTEERETRLREGRCLYCGGLGHIARECPSKPDRPMHASSTNNTSTVEANSSGSSIPVQSSPVTGNAQSQA